MRLALIFNKTRPDTTGVYFERACGQLGLAHASWLLSDVDSVPSGWDLYLRIDHGDDYEVSWPSGLRPSAFYAIDTHLPRSWRRIRRLATRHDVVFCAQRAAAERLPNGAWLPFGCDLEYHAANGRLRSWDLAFVGTDGGVPRKFYLQALRERYPNSCIGTAPATELGLVYGQARIGFNYSIAGDVNMRVFEILASGALLLTNALPTDDLERLGLHHGRHLVLYRSPGELLKAIDYYLAHEPERAAIAQAGAELVRKEHTYVHRLQHVLAAVPWQGSPNMERKSLESQSCGFS